MKNDQNHVWIQDNTWQEVRDYLKKKDIIVLPVGSTEQHGPAAAVGLDAYVAIYLAEDLAKEKGLLVAPPVWYGDSQHHQAFPGTISVKSVVFIEYLKDILRNLIGQGFKKIILINGNKVANLPTMQIATKEVHEYDFPESVLAIADPWKIARGIAPSLKGETIEHHGGVLEVSELLYKRPDLVKKDKLNSNTIDYEAIFSPWGLYDLFGAPHNPGKDGIDIAWNSKEEKAIVPEGQFSDNSRVSEEIGKKYHEYMLKTLGEFVDWLEKYKGPIGKADKK